MNKDFDILIIGGGAAGMMAAISARRHNPDASIAILDRTFALGRKILVCGAGRCNITNINLDSSIDTHYYGAKDSFIKSIFDQFGFDDIVNFFTELGVDLYIERKTDIGKMFPVTDQAKTITEMMLDEIERNGIQVFLNTEVTDLIPNNHSYTIKTKQTKKSETPGIEKTYISKKVILSAGGMSYPALGANGSGYKLAQSLSHELIKPVPAALPLVSKNPLSHTLQRIKMEIEVTSVINNEEIKTTKDDVMFTKYGFSGPAVLNVSRELTIHFNREEKNNASIRLNFFPGKNSNEVLELLESRWNKRADQSIEKSLFGIFPNKMPAVLLRLLNINKDAKVSSISKEAKFLIAGKLTKWEVRIDGTRGWNEAEFTAGGIDTESINETTLESKNQPGLYVCGEILDVDGDVGGFNLSWSWASGFVAGKILNN